MDTTHKSTSTPISYDKKYVNNLHEIIGPELIEYQSELEKMGFKRRKLIKELFFVVVILRLELLYAGIQYEDQRGD